METTRIASESTAKQRLTVAQILEDHHWQKHLDDKALSPERKENVARVLRHLTACRTGRLGSHLYRCSNCGRGLMGMDHCDDRHCVTCGDERRDAWRQEMISWSLDCDYFHVVFTLPHEFNLLIYVNNASMLEMLMVISKDTILRVMREEFGCVPGITQMLHTWGQKGNGHGHTHNLTTAGGLSLDGTRWITVDPKHPKMQPDYLAGVFRKMFVTRVGHRLRRDKLIWPTRDLLPQGECHQALGLISQEQMLWLCGPEPVVPSATQVADVHSQPEESHTDSIPVVKRATRRKRDLTAQERLFLKERKAQKWIVHCQVTPPGYQGPKRAISYLARYMAGVAISDQRLVSDSGGVITISYKDYKKRKKTGQKYGELCLSSAEFMLRFMLHILPRNMARVRHAGLFTASGREVRLAKCRLLILAAKQGPVVIESSGATPTAASPSAQSQGCVTVQAAAHDQKFSDQANNDQATSEQRETEEHAVACKVDVKEVDEGEPPFSTFRRIYSFFGGLGWSVPTSLLSRIALASSSQEFSHSLTSQTVRVPSSLSSQAWPYVPMFNWLTIRLFWSAEGLEWDTR